MRLALPLNYSVADYLLGSLACGETTVEIVTTGQKPMITSS